MSVTPEAPPPDRSEARLTLRVTIRCLTEDLGRSADHARLEPTDLDDPIVSKFVQMRSQNPVGGEIIQGISSRPCYSLHSGRHRGATWHDEDYDAVWLLAAGYHEKGSPDDAYEHFQRLDATGQLLPTDEDYEHLFESQDESFIDAIRSDVESLLQEARGTPGQEVRRVLGGQVPVSLVVEEGEGGNESRCLAVSYRFTGSGAKPPKEWLSLILVLFFPWTTDPLSETRWEQHIGGRESDSHESIWCAESPG